MLVCRKSSNGDGISQQTDPQSQPGKQRRKLGEGGPVFFPRRKPSVLAEQLLAQAGQVTAYDDDWFAGRPST